MIKILINNVGGQGTYAAYSVLHVPTRACKGGQTRSVDKERPPARHTKASLVTELPVMELDINISFLAQYYSSSFSSTKLSIILSMNRYTLKHLRTSTFASANAFINRSTRRIPLLSQCSARRVTHTPSRAPPLPTLHRAPVVPSVPAQTRMRTGRRYQTLLSDGESRIELPSGIIVSSLPPCCLPASAGTFHIDESSGKKIKRRLEDLERRAGSSSASPEQSHAELVTPVQPRRKTDDGVKRQKSKSEKTLQQQRSSAKRPSATYPATKEDRSNLFNRQYSRDMSASPPPYSNYSYPLPEPVIHTPYPQHAPIHTLPSRFPDFQGQPLYLPPLPVTLPSMSSYDLSSTKNECLFDDEDMLSQSYMAYQPLNNMDIPTAQSYQDSNVHVNHPEYSFRFQ